MKKAFLVIMLFAAALAIFYYSINYKRELKERKNHESAKEVFLYYYNPEKDKDEKGNILCSGKGLVTVKRQIFTENLIFDAIKELISGYIEPEEKKQGITSEFPLEGFELIESLLNKDSVLELSFRDIYNKTIGGACRVGILRLQIEATAKQFSGVREVKFLPEDLFQP